MNWNIEKVNKALETLKQKATIDNEFRTLCLNNPAEAVKQATGMEVPEGFKLRVIDNAGAHLTVVLPDLQVGEGELDETELTQVSGGARSKNSLTLS
ncbi:NHLP leader peptide family RiPP precursor [Aneurinibacillus aneurinilyticus]|uniref:NHLP leader peptide family natural product n=1 Tax=Aneurinibacillus aneurinilyticus TaxID=1391 RepID=A0A848CQ76_ANEAE|nr:NHLP leader peptide family RiPP precursor [Aneurinibacillus aneurinilyticus]NME99554.1 NHLP leader peptide family natural product precursor [Aneurinibacillus aneurinilyticus]